MEQIKVFTSLQMSANDRERAISTDLSIPTSLSDPLDRDLGFPGRGKVGKALPHGGGRGLAGIRGAAPGTQGHPGRVPRLSGSGRRDEERRRDGGVGGFKRVREYASKEPSYATAATAVRKSQTC